jgi:photosystem II stability/assembly factor-like uncharacterized protein
MERPQPPSRTIPPRALVIIAASALAIIVASLVYLWPTTPKRLHPVVLQGIPGPAAYASYDLVAESESDAYVLQRLPGGSANLYRTRDVGATWHRIELPASAPGFQVVVTSLPGGKLFLRSFGFATGAQQFYVGDGTTWSPIMLPDQGSGSLQMIDARLGFYVVTQTGGTPSVQEFLIYRTVDGGQHWEQRIALSAGHPNGGGLRLSDDNRFVGFSDAMHAWLVVVPPSWGIVCGTTSPKDPIQQLMASQDGGATWAPVSLPNLPQFSTELGTPFFPRAGGAGYLTVTVNTYLGQCPPVGLTYAYTTLDDGATWSGPERMPASIFDSPDGIVWWASDGRQVFRSNNQGQSWKTIKPELPAAAVTLVELSAVDAQTAWSVWSQGNDQSGPQQQALLRTTDTGTHWSEVTLPGV